MLWLDKLLHPTVLIFEDGAIRAAKGKLSSKTLRDLQTISSDHHIEHGSITLNGAGRVHFSKEIPTEAHQSIRNILASH